MTSESRAELARLLTWLEAGQSYEAWQQDSAAYYVRARARFLGLNLQVALGEWEAAPLNAACSATAGRIDVSAAESG